VIRRRRVRRWYSRCITRSFGFVKHHDHFGFDEVLYCVRRPNPWRLGRRDLQPVQPLIKFDGYKGLSILLDSTSGLSNLSVWKELYIYT